MSALSFRTATPDDAPALQRLVQSAFRATDPRPDWIGDSGLAASFYITEAEILDLVNEPSGGMFLATDEQGRLVGTIGVALRSPGEGRLKLLAVDPDSHRGGLGRQIVAYAEEWCRERMGADRTTLNALSNRKGLIAWYGRQGYQKTGDTPFPYDRFPDRGIPPGLMFVELEKKLQGSTAAAGVE